MNICMEQSFDLFHKLSSLNSTNLPDELNDSIQAVSCALGCFIKVVDRFVHNVDDVSNINVIKDIIETCPHFLTSRNKHGLLPIHTACFRDSCSVYVPIFARMGRMYGLFAGERGGRLEMTSKGHNTFELLAGSTDAIYRDDQCLVETMKILMKNYEDEHATHDARIEIVNETSDDKLTHCMTNGPLLFKEELNHSGYLLKALNNERICNDQIPHQS